MKRNQTITEIHIFCARKPTKSVSKVQRKFQSRGKVNTNTMFNCRK